MKLDFKRFLSSLLAFVMTFSAMTIGNVSTAFAGTVDLSDGQVKTLTLNKTWANNQGGASTGEIDGLTYDISKADSGGIYLNAATNYVKFTPSANCDVAITTKGGKGVDVSGDGITTTTISAGKTVTIEGLTADTEYTIVATSNGIGSSNGIATMVFTPKGGDTPVDPTYSITANTTNPVAGHISITDADNAVTEGSDGSNSLSASSKGDAFRINYAGPDYSMTERTETGAEGGADVDITSDLTPTLYTISGTVYKANDNTTGYQPTGALSINGADITVNADGAYSIGDVTYWNTDNTAVSQIVYSDTTGDGSTMSPVDLAEVFATAYNGGTTTITDNDLTITINAVVENATIAGTITGTDIPTSVTLTVGSNTYTSSVADGAFSFSVPTTEIGQAATLTAVGYTLDPTSVTALATDSFANVTATKESAGGDYNVTAPVDFTGLTATDGTYTLTFGTNQEVKASNLRNMYVAINNGATTAWNSSNLTLKTASSGSGGTVDDTYVEFMLDQAYTVTITSDTSGSGRLQIKDTAGNDMTQTVSSPTITAELPAGVYRIYPKAVNSGAQIKSIAFKASGSTPGPTTTTVAGTLSAAPDTDTVVTMTVNGHTYTATVAAGSTAITFENVATDDIGKAATLTADGYTFDAITALAEALGTVGTKTDTPIPGSKDLYTLDLTTGSATAGAKVSTNDGKLDVYGVISPITSGNNYVGEYTLTDGYTVGGSATVNVTTALEAGGNSTTTTGGFRRVMVVNLSADGDLVIAGSASSRTLTVAPYNAADGSIDTANAISQSVNGNKLTVPFTGLKAGTYAIYSSGSTRYGLIGATVPFAKLPGAITVTANLAAAADEDMRLTVSVEGSTDTYTTVVKAGATTATFDIPDTNVGKVLTLTSSSHTIAVDGGNTQTLLSEGNTFTIVSATPIVYAYRVDTTGLSKAPTGTFTFKQGSTTLAADGTVVKASAIDVSYTGDDYSFTGGYVSMTAGEANASLGVTIDSTTTPETMVLNLANCPAFQKTLGTTSVPRETVMDTPERKEWIYKLQSGNYEAGYLPLTNTVADSGVINASGSPIGHGPNNEYAGEAYGGIDTKDTAASSGDNKVLFTPGSGTELQDTNGDGTKGLITTMYLPLPQDINTGKLTVSGSVYTDAAASQWTMMQIGDVGGLRTSQSKVSPTVYGLRLGNGSKSNSPYPAGTDDSKLYDVMTENQSKINATAGWMEYELVVDFTAKEITLNLGTAIITASFDMLPADFQKVGYIKTMTETKNKRNVTVGDTTIVWEPPVDRTTCAVTLDATNKTTDYYLASVLDADGNEVTTVNISRGTTDNETAESLSLGELPVGDYKLLYLHNGVDASTSVDITTFDFSVTNADVSNGTKTVETTISEKAKVKPVITVTITNNAINGTDYPARLYMVDANNSPIACADSTSELAADQYLNGKVNAPSSVGDVTTWTIDCDALGIELADGTYSFIIESNHGIVSTVTQAVTIDAALGSQNYTGAVELNDIESDILPVPYNESDSAYFEFGSSKNSKDGIYTGNVMNNNGTVSAVTDAKYFSYNTATFTSDSNHLIFPQTGDNAFIFAPMYDSKMVIKLNEGCSFAPGVYSLSDMSAAVGDVADVSKTGTYTYYVKGGTIYTIYGLANKTSRLQQLQLRPITDVVKTLNVTVDAINKADKQVSVNIYDGSTYMETIDVPANQTTALNIPLTKKYVAGKTYNFVSMNNSIKIESQEFTIPADATTYTAKVTLGVPQGLHIVLRNAPSSYKITFNGKSNTYTSTNNDFAYDVVAGQKYEISFANERQISKWPTKDWFTYDNSAKKYYIQVPADYEAGATIYYDFMDAPLSTLYAADNATSVAGASVGYGQYGFGDEKVAITDADARTTLEYAGIVPSLNDFRGSYEYSAREGLKLGYDESDSTDGANGVLGYNNDGTLDDNRLLINANTDSYIKFTSTVNGMCKVDRSMHTILVHEDSATGTSVSTTTSTNKNYQFFSVEAGKTYYITGDTKTSNTHVKSVRIFPKDNLFHFNNIQKLAEGYQTVLDTDVLKTNGNVTVKGSGTNNADDIVQRLFGYLEQDAVDQTDIFDSIDYVGWTFVKKADVDTFEALGRGYYNPNMPLGETTDPSFAGIDPANNKNLSGRSLYEMAYDYSKEPVNGEYTYNVTNTSGPLMLRHIAAKAGTEYYAYPYTVYKGTNIKSYTLSTDEKYGETGNVGNLWRTVVTF